MKKLLITGHRGLLGSACVRYFQGKHRIATSLGYDISSEEETRELFFQTNPDVVINCAAKVGGVKSNRDNPVEFLENNLNIQNNVIKVSHENKVETLINIGTSCMFPRDAQVPVEESSLLTGRLEPSVEAYAIAKIAGWRLCKAYWEQYGDRFLTIAPSNIYGPGDNYSEQAHVIPALIRKYHHSATTGEPFKVWGDGTAIREFTYVDDVCSAIETIIDKWNSPEVINVGTGLGTTIRDLVWFIKDTIPKPFPSVPTEWDVSQPTGIPNKTFSTKNLTGLGWQPKVTLREGLEQTWTDYLATPKPRGM